MIRLIYFNQPDLEKNIKLQLLDHVWNYAAGWLHYAA